MTERVVINMKINLFWKTRLNEISLTFISETIIVEIIEIIIEITIFRKKDNIFFTLLSSLSYKKQ